jgi:hypothetical protein
MVKLLGEGKNKAEIGRIMRRSRRIVWKTLKDFDKKHGRRHGPGQRRQRQPRARCVLSWWAPATVMDAFGD